MRGRSSSGRLTACATADEVPALAVDPHGRDRHAAGDELLDERGRVALDLVEQRADAGDSGRQAGPRGVDDRHARRRDVVDVDGGRRAERADRGDRAAQMRVGLGDGRAAAELELAGRRDVGQALDARDAHRADTEPVAQRRADARRGGQHRAEREQERRARRRARARAAPGSRTRRPRRARSRGSRATRACTAVARSGVGGHATSSRRASSWSSSSVTALPTSSTPACARRRSSAREVRDLTVPRRQPSAAAVSSSESSSR